MNRLILTTDDSRAGSLKAAALADCTIAFGQRFVWGKVPSPVELDAFLSPRSASHNASASRWFDHLSGNAIADARAHGPGFADFCGRFETVELWIGPDPNAQLILVWLLDHLRPHQEICSRLHLVQADIAVGKHTPEEFTACRLPVAKIQNHHLETASAAWRAFYAPTPKPWFGMLSRDLSALPQLGPTVLEWLEELPERATGLGATEMRMLELISEQHEVHPFDLFPGDGKPNQRRVFGYWEVGSLLDGLARCPAPVVSGLDDGPFTLEMLEDRSRHARYKQSTLSLTVLGEAVLARTEDFSRHNPVHRWWGGTELTGGHLCRWDPADRILIAP